MGTPDSPAPDDHSRIANQFGYFWCGLVDTLKEMGVPFVMGVQFDPADKERPHAYHLPRGGSIDPRMIFAAVLVREGLEKFGSLFPSFNLERVEKEADEALKEISMMEQADAPMRHMTMPMFADSMRDIGTGEPGGDHG